MVLADTAPIDMAEAAYNLQLGAQEWLPNLLDKGAPLLDHGLGCAAAIWGGQSRDGQSLIAQLCVGSGPADLGLRFAHASKSVGSLVRQQTEAARSAGVQTASECEFDRASMLRAVEKHVGCMDVLGVWALDPDLHGVGIGIPDPERIVLSKAARKRFERLAVHIAAGHRLRRRLGCADELQATPLSEIPLGAEAVIDPKGFVVAHAEGHAGDKNIPKALRDAAIRIDKARSKLRRENADQALEVWQGLVRGRWSLVDWFDSDGRRFVLVVPNAPGLGDPRGLTEREHQVATFAGQGESSKLITYRLGISPQRVSALLQSAMRKLGVKTRPQLVMKMRGFQAPSTGVA